MRRNWARFGSEREAMRTVDDSDDNSNDNSNEDGDEDNDEIREEDSDRSADWVCAGIGPVLVGRERR